MFFPSCCNFHCFYSLRRLFLPCGPCGTCGVPTARRCSPHCHCAPSLSLNLWPCSPTLVYVTLSLLLLLVQSDAQKGGGEASSTASQTTTTEQYDAVVICNGHYEVPYEAPLPGIENFKGTCGFRVVLYDVHLRWHRGTLHTCTCTPHKPRPSPVRPSTCTQTPLDIHTDLSPHRLCTPRHVHQGCPLGIKHFLHPPPPSTKVSLRSFVAGLWLSDGD